MFWRSNKLKALQKRLRRVFGDQRGMEIRLLPEDQLLIGKNLVPNPASEQGGKVESRMPGAKGYRIYVSQRSYDQYHAASSTSQRLDLQGKPLPWDAATMRLHMNPESLIENWLLRERQGHVVVISVHAGSEAVLTEINQILRDIERVLLK